MRHRKGVYWRFSLCTNWWHSTRQALHNQWANRPANQKVYANKKALNTLDEPHGSVLRKLLIRDTSGTRLFLNNLSTNTQSSFLDNYQNITWSTFEVRRNLLVCKIWKRQIITGIFYLDFKEIPRTEQNLSRYSFAVRKCSFIFDVFFSRVTKPCLAVMHRTRVGGSVCCLGIRCSAWTQSSEKLSPSTAAETSLLSPCNPDRSFR